VELAFDSEKHILNRMSWSEIFRAYIDQRFGDSAQQKAAEALKVSPSAVSYWCRGSRPRKTTRERIAEWSSGLVPKDAGEASVSKPAA
jgi:transcriptional regulator with XRE-family HTH domain